MTDSDQKPTTSVEDSLYNDDSNFGLGGATSGTDVYAYDPYQDTTTAGGGGGEQWYYNDNQTLQIPQGESSADTATANTTTSAAAVDNSNGAGYQTNTTSMAMPQQQQQQQYPYMPTIGNHRNNNDEGKLFVGGLNWDTDEMMLNEYFSKYGIIQDCTIMRDPITQRPRGFGFVTFEDATGVNAVLQEPSHVLNGKTIDPKHAIPRENQTSATMNHLGTRPNYYQQQQQQYSMAAAAAEQPFTDPVQEMKGEKIFVGGLPTTATDADLNSCFSQFGTIAETKLMMDRDTGRSRGYGFLQFATEEAALQAVKEGNSEAGINIHGKRVDVKPAFHRKRNPVVEMMGGQGGAAGYGMMGYGMMGMMGYGMMGYGDASGTGSVDANGNPVDYSASMGAYGGYYGGDMSGYYGNGTAAQEEGAEATAPTVSAGTEGALDTTNGGYYGDTSGYYNDNSTNAKDEEGSTVNGDDGSKNRGGSKERDRDRESSRRHHHRSSHRRGRDGERSHRDRDRHHDKDRDRDRDRDSRHHSSSRRHGHGHSEHRSGGKDRSSRDDRRGRGGRSGRDREGPVRGSNSKERKSTSTREHGHKPY